MTDATPSTGDRVRGALATKRIKQAEAAAVIELSQSQLSKRLSGRVAWRDGEIEKIADLCGVTVDQLTGKRRRKAVSVA